MNLFSHTIGKALLQRAYDTQFSVIVETTVGIADAPVTAAAALARISLAPGAAVLVASALKPAGLFRMKSAALCNGAISTDFARVRAAVLPFMREGDIEPESL